jgi:hypothetical protein
MENKIITSVVINFDLVRDCMIPCDFPWIESDFFLFCFIASCLKGRFSGKLKRFSVKLAVSLWGVEIVLKNHVVICLFYIFNSQLIWTLCGRARNILICKDHEDKDETHIKNWAGLCIIVNFGVSVMVIVIFFNTYLSYLRYRLLQNTSQIGTGDTVDI